MGMRKLLWLALYFGIATSVSSQRLCEKTIVNFEFGQSALNPYADSLIAILTHSMGTKGDYLIELYGRTDSVDSKYYNDELSQQRMLAVKSAVLEEEHVGKYEFRMHNFGESKPLVENSSDENRAKNRRVEIMILPLKGVRLCTKPEEV